MLFDISFFSISNNLTNTLNIFIKILRVLVRLFDIEKNDISNNIKNYN